MAPPSSSPQMLTSAHCPSDTGKNDGSVQGKYYFKCEAKHGSFVRPDRVEVGDLPVVDDLEDLEEI